MASFDAKTKREPVTRLAIFGVFRCRSKKSLLIFVCEKFSLENFHITWSRAFLQQVASPIIILRLLYTHVFNFHYYREVEPLGTAAPNAGMKNKRRNKLPLHL
jgi:hypothetical protein